MPRSRRQRTRTATNFLKAWAALFRSLSPFTTKDWFLTRKTSASSLSTATIWAVLRSATRFFLLARSGPKSMSELADNVNYDRGNMTRLVDYLVKQGLARRFQQENNRKQVYVELTAKGYALIDEEEGVFVKNMRDKVRDKLDDAERLDLLETLKKAASYLKRL